MLVSEGPQPVQEGGGRRVVAAFALDRLDQEHRDVVGSDLVLEHEAQFLQRVGGGIPLGHAPAVRMRERGDKDRPEDGVVAVAVLGVRRRVRHRPHRPSVEGAPKGDDALAPGDLLGELHTGLDGLGSRVGEGELLDAGRGYLAQLLCGVDDRVVAEHAARMNDPIELAMGGCHDVGVIVPEVGGRGAADEVRPLVPGRVVHPKTLGLLDH